MLGLVPEGEPSDEESMDPQELLPKDGESEIVAIVRDGHVFIPNATTQMKPGDQIAILAGPEAVRALRSRLTMSGDET